MKALWAFATGLLLLGAPALADPADGSGTSTRKPVRHVSKVRAARHDDAGTLIVVNGSDIRITPYGEVVVPPTSVISVDDNPAANRPDMSTRPMTGTPPGTSKDLQPLNPTLRP